MGREATMYLLERGVRVTGTDGWSWDAPFVFTMKTYAETHNASLAAQGFHGQLFSGESARWLSRLD